MLFFGCQRVFAWFKGLCMFFQGAAWLSVKLSRIALGLRVFNGFKRFLWVFTVFKDRSWSLKGLKAFKSFSLAVKGCSCFSGCLSPPACILEAVSRILRFPPGVSRFSKGCRDA